MNFTDFKNYNLEGVLSSETEQLWNHIAKTLNCKSYIDIYKVFLLTTHQENIQNFCIVTYLRDTSPIEHFSRLIGFIITELSISDKTTEAYFRTIHKIFYKICTLNLKIYNPIPPKLNKEFLNNSVNTYKNSYINISKKIYFEGWKANSSDEKTLNLNFSIIYDLYGENFFNNFKKAISTILSKYIYSTAQRKLIHIKKLFMYIASITHDLYSLESNLSPNTAHLFFIKLYKIQLIDVKLKNEDLHTFHKNWLNQVIIYMELVNLNLFQKPYIDIITPNFKTSKKNKTNLKIKGANQVVHSKLITDIPISVTDDEAIRVILKKIEYDIEFIVNYSKLEVENTLIRLKKFLKNASLGKIKKRKDSDSNSNPVKVGVSNIENVCATYLSSPYRNNDVVDYSNFLGVETKKELNEILFFSSNDVLYPFMILLINEHPFITEAWLTNFKLYDKNQLVGFRQIENDWIITSVKKRRGTVLAEQTENTTMYSKYVIEQILNVTKIARDYLKKKQSKDYEYLFIGSVSPFIEPKKFETISHPNSIKSRTYLKDSFRKNHYATEYIDEYGEDALNDLIQNFTLTKFRASCAIKIYLETQSIYEMSKALGHKEFQKKLMEAYLPDPIWKFFTTRWILIFQNALVFEAMKDSDYLFKAVDFTKEELNTFIENHAFKELPTQIRTYKTKQFNNEIKTEKIGIFPISVALLQWFIGINEFVLLNGIQNLNEIAELWYESAMLVVTQIELAINDINSFKHMIEEPVIAMYKKAKNNPLPIGLVEGALT